VSRCFTSFNQNIPFRNLQTGNKPQSSAVTGAGGSSNQLAAGDPVTPAPAAARAAAAAAAGGVIASMVGMYQHQLHYEPLGALSGGHCGDQPRLAVASSSPSVALAAPLAQAHGGGETRQLFGGLIGGSVLRGGGKGSSAGWDLETVVRWVRELAMDPVATRPAPAEDRARKRQVRALRRARYLRLEEVADAAELPSFRVSQLSLKHSCFVELNCDLFLILIVYYEQFGFRRLVALRWLRDCSVWMGWDKDFAFRSLSLWIVLPVCRTIWFGFGEWKFTSRRMVMTGVLRSENHYRCPITMYFWKAGRLLPEKADLDLDHLDTSSCQPGQYMPESYRVSHFQMPVAWRNTLFGGLLPVSVVIPSKSV
jgi:hypothetical protein